MDSSTDRAGASPASRAIINAPRAVIVMIGVFVAVHLALQWIDNDLAEWLSLALAFSPARLAPPAVLAGTVLPGGEGAKYWTFFSHMFLHGDWLHLAINSVWMLAFGSVAARHLGALRFVAFTLFCAAAGAVASQVVYWGTLSFMIGASGAVSGQMAGAIRLMFAGGKSLSLANAQAGAGVKPLSLAATFRHRRAMTFIAVWMVLNLVFGLTGVGAPADVGRIAWEAHTGGFVGGLLVFGLFARRNVS